MVSGGSHGNKVGDVCSFLKGIFYGKISLSWLFDIKKKVDFSVPYSYANDEQSCSIFDTSC